MRKRRPDVFGVSTPRYRTDLHRQTIRRLGGEVRLLQGLPRRKKPDSSAMETLNAATLHPPNTSSLLSLLRQIRNIRNIRSENVGRMCLAQAHLATGRTCIAKLSGA